MVGRPLELRAHGDGDIGICGEIGIVSRSTAVGSLVVGASTERSDSCVPVSGLSLPVPLLPRTTTLAPPTPVTLVSPVNIHFVRTAAFGGASAGRRDAAVAAVPALMMTAAPCTVTGRRRQARWSIEGTV